MGVERATLKHLHLPQRWPEVTVVLLRIIVWIDQEGLICLVVLLRERQGRINWAMLHVSLLLADAIKPGQVESQPTTQGAPDSLCTGRCQCMCMFARARLEPPAERAPGGSYTNLS